MCSNCGCGPIDAAVLHVSTEPDHHHSPLFIEHLTEPHQTQTLNIHTSLLAKNDRFAQQNRDRLEALGLLTLNILSSPGSGKTSLIEQTAKSWNQAPKIGVIVGDLATENDAQRLRLAGATALQITTGTTCHLEADTIAHGLAHLALESLEILIIENVGNLVCPAAYDLGEALRVVLLSVTEGEDKPLKYPTAFQSADVVVLTKMDIAEVVGFDRASAIANIQHMAPKAQIFELSARTGMGMASWLAFLQAQRLQARPSQVRQLEAQSLQAQSLLAQALPLEEAFQ